MKEVNKNEEVMMEEAKGNKVGSHTVKGKEFKVKPIAPVGTNFNREDLNEFRDTVNQLVNRENARHMTAEEKLHNTPTGLKEFAGQYVVYFSDDTDPRVLFHSFVKEEADVKAKEMQEKEQREPVVMEVTNELIEQENVK